MAIGIPASKAGAQHLVSSLLCRAKPFDFPVLATAAGAIALIAAWILARRVAMLDPTVVLKEE